MTVKSLYVAITLLAIKLFHRLDGIAQGKAGRAEARAMAGRL